MRKLMLVLALLLCQAAFSDGGSSSGTRGGGDEVGLEAKHLLDLAVRELAAAPALGPLVDIQALTEAAARAQIIVVDTPLTVLKGNIFAGISCRE